MNAVTRVTRKGQITIPAELRREFAIEIGDRLEWGRDGNCLVLRPAESVVRRTAGIARKYSRGPAPTIEELKAAAAQGWIDGYLMENQD